MKVASVYHRGASCIAAGNSLEHAARILAAGNIGALPVFEGEELAGILSERDLVRALAEGVDLRQATAGSRMTRRPATVSPEADGLEAVEMMLVLGVRHLPVRQDGRLLGMVSIRDLLPSALWRRRPALRPRLRPKGTPKTIAAHALRDAECFLSEEPAQLLEEAGSDPGLIYEAAQVIREQAPNAGVARSPEHLAFTILAEAHARLRKPAVG